MIDPYTVEYAIAEAYKKFKTKEGAVREVGNIYPFLSNDILRLMWSAIDAYVDREDEE